MVARSYQLLQSGALLEVQPQIHEVAAGPAGAAAAGAALFPFACFGSVLSTSLISLPRTAWQLVWSHNQKHTKLIAKLVRK